MEKVYLIVTTIRSKKDLRILCSNVSGVFRTVGAAYSYRKLLEDTESDLDSSFSVYTLQEHVVK